MPTRSAATAARPQISARLPVSDWQIRWRRQPDGRTVLEVTDQAGNLTGLVTSTRLPIVSVDGARRANRSAGPAGPGRNSRVVLIRLIRGSRSMPSSRVMPNPISDWPWEST
jgi:hypothetical protein